MQSHAICPHHRHHLIFILFSIPRHPHHCASRPLDVLPSAIPFHLLGQCIEPQTFIYTLPQNVLILQTLDIGKNLVRSCAIGPWASKEACSSMTGEGKEAITTIVSETQSD